MNERNYDFLQRLREIHRPKRRDPQATPAAAEVAITDDWCLVLGDGFAPAGEKALFDLQHYLQVSMGVSLRIAAAEQSCRPCLVLRQQAIADAPRGSFRLEVKDSGIILSTADLQGLWSGIVHLEDTMSFREAPFLPAGCELRQPLIRVRRTHSSCGVDDFPDWQLCAIAHAGFNTIEVFVKDFDRTTRGYCNINELIDRAEEYGIDTFLYNYLPSYKHPDDPDAEEFFDSVYGELFRRYPKAIGIKLCGESLEFPSKDPATTGKRWRESVVDGIPDTRPSPGWWPCQDYPAYLTCIRNAIRKVSPSAEIVINTYNWGYAPAEKRRQLLAALPKDMTVQVTFEIFKQHQVDGLSCPIADYSILATEPGEYFTSECAIAHELGLQLCSTSNSVGATWDFGAASYVPTPYRWITRFKHLNAALENWGVDEHYETHHYAWWPNAVIDLRNANAWSPREEDLEAVLEKVAIRDYGKDAAPQVLSTWRYWSQAMDFYIASNEDQYGPWRVGAAYPLIFQPNITRTMGSKEIQFPTAPQAHFGHRIIKTLYQPYENESQSPGPLRYPKEIRRLEQMLKLWEQGLQTVQSALNLMPERKRPEGQRLVALGQYIFHSIQTTLNVKNWWLLNTKLQASSDKQEMLAILEQLEELAAKEIQNARELIPAVEFDSRLGWEPSMEYVCDKWHLEWKIRQVNSALKEIKTYRKMINL
jgi:hypothetical protein